jgi:hypothetical protein
MMCLRIWSWLASEQHLIMPTPSYNAVLGLTILPDARWREQGGVNGTVGDRK